MLILIIMLMLIILLILIFFYSILKEIRILQHQSAYETGEIVYLFVISLLLGVGIYVECFFDVVKN